MMLCICFALCVDKVKSKPNNGIGCNQMQCANDAIFCRAIHQIKKQKWIEKCIERTGYVWIGCVSAAAATFLGELNLIAIKMRKKNGQTKVHAFAIHYAFT